MFLGLAVFLGALLLIFDSAGSPPRITRIGATPKTHVASSLVAQLAPHGLPRPLSGEAVVGRPNGVLVVGGLNSSDESTMGVVELSSQTGRVTAVGSLSQPRHDLAAAALNTEVLVFGGGSATELESVESLRPGGSGKLLGRLPTTRSDLSVVAVNGRAYVLGGYDGQAPTATILQTTDGRRFAAVGALPVPFRYAATAAVEETIYAFGGELASGADTGAIQAFDTRTGRTNVIGHLPRPLSHDSAVALGGRIYILGGSEHGTPTNSILSFDPATRHVRSAGHLPLRVTNAAATSVGGVGYLIGGLDARGASLASVIDVRVVSREV